MRVYLCSGVVIGALLPTGEIDVPLTRLLLLHARPMTVTFHRAFDVTPDPFKALEDLVHLGVDRVLTSGQRQTAIEGKELIKTLVEASEGRVIILPGGGIDESNVEDLVEYTRVSEIHCSARESQESKMMYRPPVDIYMGGVKINEPRKTEYLVKVASCTRISKILSMATKSSTSM